MILSAGVVNLRWRASFNLTLPGSLSDQKSIAPLQALLGPLPQDAAGGSVHPRVCQVLVVDDGSSTVDRGMMLSAFPRFTYLFKGPGDVKGARAVVV